MPKAIRQHTRVNPTLCKLTPTTAKTTTKTNVISVKTANNVLLKTGFIVPHFKITLCG